MSWAIGYDYEWNRDIGYGVPCACDHPGCDKEIHRGLSYVCGSEPYGGEHGCGLYFCPKHLGWSDDNNGDYCERCRQRKEPFEPKPDIQKWVDWKETDPSWAEWREKRDAEK